MLYKVFWCFFYTLTSTIWVSIFKKKISCLVQQGIKNLTELKESRGGGEKSLLTGKSVVCFSSPKFVTLWTCNLWNSVQLGTPINYQFWKHPTDFRHSDILIERIQFQVSFTGSPRQLGKLFLTVKLFTTGQLGGECESSGSNNIWNINPKLHCPHHTGCQNTITMLLAEWAHLSHGFKKGIF